VPEVDEQEDDLLECVDHQHSSFERGKPQSILSLLLIKIILYIYIYYIYIYIYIYMSLYIVALIYRSCVRPLMHLLLSLPTLLPN
jgi:hypothetical protein